MLKKVKSVEFCGFVSCGESGVYGKYVVEHKNLGEQKICVCRKVGVTLHSLSGSNGCPPRKRAPQGGGEKGH